MTGSIDAETADPGAIDPGAIDPGTVDSGAMEEAVTALLHRLERECADFVAAKTRIEEEWTEDMRALYGRYDEQTERDLKEHRKSRLFANMTRPKTHAWEARLADLLFPTNDRNWGIGPTPVPELALAIARDPGGAPGRGPQTPNMTDGGQNANNMNAEGVIMEGLNTQSMGGDSMAGSGRDAELRARALSARAILDEARRRADAMQDEIEDQLIQGGYQAANRRVIKDMCRLGTGILKGPVTTGDTRERWVAETGADGRTHWRHSALADETPKFVRVDPWSFFPDPGARIGEDLEKTYERHLLTKKALRDWAKRPGFYRDAVRRLLADGPADAVPSYLADLRAITQDDAHTVRDRYVAWEYRGPLDADDLKALFAHAGDDTGLAAIAGADILTDVQVVIYFCQGQVLAAGLHPLDSRRSLYDACPFFEDEASLWGYGVPRLMRDAQKAINASWRMMMDNGDLSTGPQIVVKKSKIMPADGSMAIKGRKIWYADETTAVGDAFATFPIDSRQGELMNIFELARRLVDDEVSLPLIAQGEQGAQTTRTASGLSLLMNSANVIFRWVVTNWDDHITVPAIRKQYHYNMQFSPRDEIKGDMSVEARGSSVLLVRELQAQNIMTVLANFIGHPVLGRYVREYNSLKAVYQTLMLDAKELLYSKEEVEQRLAEAAEAEAQAQAEQAQEQQAQADPMDDPRTARLAFEREKLAAELEDRAAERAARLNTARLTNETALIKALTGDELAYEKLRAVLADKAEDRLTKERIFQGEMHFKERQSRREAMTGKDLPDGTRFAP
ncbi:hypothetical protein [Eilatimonas milleporae]|uniref:hypothetical protein n=1 Tax=Eilatimonas milleporae TaxID=911205 RepID=UPI0011C3E6AE|nr:hypothetical protein [Eilatimonas milleporae]